MSLMGIGTFFIGLLPGYASLGHCGTNSYLIVFRLVQGLALGGEYGGAAIYVAEHAPPNRRGYYTSWIQTTATLGLFLALLLILGIRTWMGEAIHSAIGAGVFHSCCPASCSVVSIWIRLSLERIPDLCKKMKEEGTTSKRPLSEAFGEWSNAKIAILALFGATAGEAVVWYGGQFYALFFLTQTIKVPAVDRADHDRDCAGARHPRLRPVRLAVRQDRPQADHPGRLPAGGVDLFPDLQGDHALRQSEAGDGALGSHRSPSSPTPANVRSSSRRRAPKNTPPAATWPSPRSSTCR